MLSNSERTGRWIILQLPCYELGTGSLLLQMRKLSKTMRACPKAPTQSLGAASHLYRLNKNAMERWEFLFSTPKIRKQIRLRIGHCQPSKPEIENKTKHPKTNFNYIKTFVAVKVLKGFLPQHFPKSTRKWNNRYKYWKIIKLTLWLIMGMKMF